MGCRNNRNNRIASGNDKRQENRRQKHSVWQGGAKAASRRGRRRRRLGSHRIIQSKHLPPRPMSSSRIRKRSIVLHLVCTAAIHPPFSCLSGRDYQVSPSHTLVSQPPAGGVRRNDNDAFRVRIRGLPPAPRVSRSILSTASLRRLPFVNRRSTDYFPVVVVCCRKQVGTLRVVG